MLFLDEPTAGVDVYNRGLFWELIQEEADKGVTVFVTTHFLEEVEYCDWASFIDAGRVIADAAPETLRRRYGGASRIEVKAPPEARSRASDVLARHGVTSTPAAGGLSAEVAALDPALLAALGEFEAATPSAAVRVEQPPMTEVFRRLLAEAAAGAG